MSNFFTNVSENVSKILERPLLISLIVLIILSSLVVWISLPYYLWDFENFMVQILAEAHGMILNIAVIGIFVYWLNQKGETRQRIRSYKDEIDDFRKWKSEEAAFRNMGNIKRLNRHNISSLDLVDVHLEKANLNYVNLTKSNLNSATFKNSSLIGGKFNFARMNQTDFENANLNKSSIKRVYAGGANFKDAFLIKSEMSDSFLIKANFENAYLMEANLTGANLTEVNFENSSLYKADLRGVKGLTVEQISKAKTLYMAKIDSKLMEELKAKHPHLVNNKVQIEPR